MDVWCMPLLPLKFLQFITCLIVTKSFSYVDRMGRGEELKPALCKEHFGKRY